MGQKETVNITLIGMLRWIFGLCFVLITLAMIIVHEYFSAVFMLIVVFLLFPPISNFIDSKLNLSVSGALRFSMVILFLAGSFAVEPIIHLQGLLILKFFQDLITQLRMTMFVSGLEMT